MPHRLLLICMALCLVAGPASAAEGGQWWMPGGDTVHSCCQALAGRMVEAPSRVIPLKIGSTHAGGPMDNWSCIADVDGDGKPELLWKPSGQVVCTDPRTGENLWGSNLRDFDHIVDMDGDGTLEIVCTTTIYNAASGELIWDSGRAGGRAGLSIGDFDPDSPGLELAHTVNGDPQHIVLGRYYHFPNGLASGELAWEKTLKDAYSVSDYGSAVVGDIDGKGSYALAFSGCGQIGAVSLPDGEWVFDTPLVGGAGRRHYSQIFVRDVDSDDIPEIVLIEDIINLRLAVLQPNVPDQPVRWHKLIDSWYPIGEHSMHAALTSLADVDGDGEDEIVISVHHKSTDWTLYCYSTADGSLEWAVPHLYLHQVADLNGDGMAEIIAAPMIPRNVAKMTGVVLGTLKTTAGGPEFVELWRAEAADVQYNKHYEMEAGHGGRCQDPLDVFIQDFNADGRLEFLVGKDDDGDRLADRILVVGMSQAGEAEVVAEFGIEGRDNLTVAAWDDMRPEPGPEMLVGDDTGAWYVLGADGEPLLELRPEQKQVDDVLSAVSVADLDGDGINEILGAFSGGFVGAFHLPAEGSDLLQEVWRVRGAPILQVHSKHSAIHAPDLDGDRKREVLLATGEPGQVGQVTLFNHDGTERWTAVIQETTVGADVPPVHRINFGEFNGDGVLDVFVPRGLGRSYGGAGGDCIALDGRDGSVLWRADRTEAYDNDICPSTWAPVFDFNHDGIDDVLSYSRAFINVINGRDGSFHIKPHWFTHNLSGVLPEGTGWTAYGHIRIADSDLDGDPDTVISAGNTDGYGAWDLRTEEPLWGARGKRWGESAAAVDIDLDGRAETIIMAQFECRDVRTGEIEWTGDELGISSTPWVSACDINGDGRIEWIGSNSHQMWAIGVGEDGRPRVLWQCQDPVYQPGLKIADVDNDGFSEIISGGYVLDE